MDTSYIQNTNVDFDLEQSTELRDDYSLSRWRSLFFLTIAAAGAGVSSYMLVTNPVSYEVASITATFGLVNASLTIIHIQTYFNKQQLAEDIDYEIFENTGDIANCKFPEAVQMKHNRQHCFER